MVFRHHVHPFAEGLLLFDGGDGLVQPPGDFLGVVQYTLDADFCVSALDDALSTGTPEIFNSDQGCQYTSEAFTGRLREAGVAISMDGKGRAFDNILTERLWRTVKYEEVFLKEYGNMMEARVELGRFFKWYNEGRPHQSLGYQTPDEVYCDRALAPTG